MKQKDFVILRFSHSFESGGGIETYLEDLDRTLLFQNPWTIIQIYLSNDKHIKKLDRKAVGQGILIRVPVPFRQRNIVNNINTMVIGKTLKEYVKNYFFDKIIYNPFLYRSVFQKMLEKRPIPHRDLEAIGVCEVLKELIVQYKINLLVMHYLGGKDSAEIIKEAMNYGIPFVFVNHFSNDRFNHLSIREQMNKAVVVAGVSRVGVPTWLRRRFVNVSDGIDTEFFNPENSKPVSIQADAPVVLLPARITPTKGQNDLIKICAGLRDEGIRVIAAFAGRVDSENFVKELRCQAKNLGIEKNILFLGELSPSQLRDWYAKATVLALPTYHHEGLARVLIESQAMKTPPISYIIGGTSEAIINGRTGFLVKKGDISVFKERLRKLLIDERMRRDMGEAGRKFIQENFSLDALASRHKELYLHAMENILH